MAHSELKEIVDKITVSCIGCKKEDQVDFTGRRAGRPKGWAYVMGRFVCKECIRGIYRSIGHK